MDQNELYETENEISRKSNKYYLFIKKTFSLLVSVSLVSFLLSHASGISFFFAYNFHFSTLVFPLFAHALERKYMFLIFNGILAFLVKTLNFNSSLSVSDFSDHDESMKSTTEVSEKLVSESTLEDVLLAGQEEEDHPSPEKTAIVEEDKLKLQEKGNEQVNVSFTLGIDEGRQAGTGIIEAEDLDMMSEVEEELDEEDMEHGGGLLGASAAEEGIEVNIDTEELNKKFEEFIRKMKEEIRIQAHQPQLITV